MFPVFLVLFPVCSQILANAFNVFSMFSISDARAISPVFCIPLLQAWEHWEQWELNRDRGLARRVRWNSRGTTRNRYSGSRSCRGSERLPQRVEPIRLDRKIPSEWHTEGPEPAARPCTTTQAGRMCRRRRWSDCMARTGPPRCLYRGPDPVVQADQVLPDVERPWLAELAETLYAGFTQCARRSGRPRRGTASWVFAAQKGSGNRAVLSTWNR